uniref:Uncharacterized protein n=1 Tax=Arundo donax TaxID=35708 RepID=A0A0A8XZ34_ARUDO
MNGGSGGRFWEFSW